MEKKKIEWLEEKCIAEAKKKSYWKLEEEILSYSGKDELGIDLRTLDRALWISSKNYSDC